MKIVTSKTLLPAPEPKVTPQEKLKEVAGLYEKEFARQLVKSMKSSVTPSGLVTQGQVEKYFTEELYNEYSDQMADQGGLGLKEKIYENLVEQMGDRLGITSHAKNPKGVFPLDPKAVEAIITKKYLSPHQASGPIIKENTEAENFLEEK